MTEVSKNTVLPERAKLIFSVYFKWPVKQRHEIRNHDVVTSMFINIWEKTVVVFKKINAAGIHDHCWKERNRSRQDVVK